MVQTHISRKLYETGNRWAIGNSFNNSIVSSRHFLQSTNTNSKLRRIWKVVKNNARSVPESMGSLFSKYKASVKLNNSRGFSNGSDERIVSMQADKLEVVNNRYDLRELFWGNKMSLTGYLQ